MAQIIPFKSVSRTYAVGVLRPFSGAMRESTANCWLALFFFYVPQLTNYQLAAEPSAKKNILTMARYVYLMLSLVLVALTSCASEKKAADSEIEFENVKKEFVGQKSEYTGDLITVSFDIDWPISGNKETVNILREWIKGNISPILLPAYEEEETIQDILEFASKDMLDYALENDFAKIIVAVNAKSNSPAEGYVTLHAVRQNIADGMMGGEEEIFNDITLRLSDNRQFNAKTAIADKELFRKAIIKSLAPDWDADIMYMPLRDIPYPTLPIALTDSGIEVRYEGGSLCSAREGWTVIIPYSEAYPTLSEEAKEFLPNDITNSSNISKESTDDVEADATAFLYHTFYSNDAISGEVSNVGRYSLGYSDEAMQKFKELGISSELDYPKNSSLANDNDYYKPYYSDDLNNLLKKVTTALNNTDNFELMMLMGYDFEGEEPSFNLHINKVDVESPEKVTITAKENPEGDEVTYRLIKKNGKWYIDDIYNYREKAKTILEN